MVQIFVRGGARGQLGAVMLVGFLTACTASSVHEARYTGALSGCGAEHASTLTRVSAHGGKDATFAFAPGDGALLVRGTVAADGTLDGSLNTQPPGKPAFTLKIHGQLGPEVADVTYTTPTCVAQGRLRRVRTGLLP